MKTSSFFEQALFKDSPTAIDDLFKRRCDQLFEQSSNDRSYIEFYVQLQSDKDDKDTQVALEAVRSGISTLPVWRSDLDSDSDSDPSSPIAKSKHSGRPPRYVGAPLYCRKILNVRSLHELAAIFPRFKDFVLLFGARHGEHEIGLPQLRSRRLFSNPSGPMQQLSSGSDKVLVASIDEKNLSFDERQILKDSEDRLVGNLLILDSTLETITSLVSVYNQFRQDCGSGQEDGYADHIDLIEMALQEQHREVGSYRRQMETLRMKVQGSIHLLSSLLDLGNGSSLKALAEEAKQENTSMHALTEKSTKDAAAVKVLTTITLIYLPVTVVSVRTLLPLVVVDADVKEELLLDRFRGSGFDVESCHRDFGCLAFCVGLSALDCGHFDCVVDLCLASSKEGERRASHPAA
ncbi:MAG: hypothetical protein Q9203_003458 [Teloschistes exilis]